MMLIPANPKGGSWIHISRRERQARIGFHCRLGEHLNLADIQHVMLTRSTSRLRIELLTQDVSVGYTYRLTREGFGTFAAHVSKESLEGIPNGSYQPLFLDGAVEIDYAGMRDNAFRIP